MQFSLWCSNYIFCMLIKVCFNSQFNTCILVLHLVNFLVKFSCIRLLLVYYLFKAFKCELINSGKLNIDYSLWFFKSIVLCVVGIYERLPKGSRQPRTCIQTQRAFTTTASIQTMNCSSLQFLMVVRNLSAFETCGH